MLSGAWALWRLCVSDFYQGKPIRPDRGMMILGHHHSGDTAPTNPTTPSSIRQHKTPSHAPFFPCSPWLPYPLTFPLQSFPRFSFLLHPHLRFLPSQTLSCPRGTLLAFCLIQSFLIFIVLYLSVYHVPSLHCSLFFLAHSPTANTKTNFALFLAHETFNISFQILADASKKWPNESYLLSSLSAITS